MEPLWRPDPAKAAATQLEAFRTRAAELSGEPLGDYAALHRWSVREPAAFWSLLWDFSNTYNLVDYGSGWKILVSTTHG